jgi:hypothetical protein
LDKSAEDEVKAVADELAIEGFSRSESYPIERWRAHGWPEISSFYKAVDGLMTYRKNLEDYERSRKLMEKVGQK